VTAKLARRPVRIEAWARPSARRLAFHAGSPGGDDPLTAARSLQTRLADGDQIATSDLLVASEARGLRWGDSDGNQASGADGRGAAARRKA